jgi:hypothetical protein
LYHPQKVRAAVLRFGRGRNVIVIDCFGEIPIKHVLSTLAAAGLASSASAQVASFSQNLGDLVVSGQTVVPIDTSVVSGDFVAFRVTTDWSVATGDPFSSEASLFFGDPSTFTIISDTAVGLNAVDSGAPVPNLTFVGEFFENPAAAPLIDFVVDNDTFGDANFDDTLIEWFQADDLPSTPSRSAAARRHQMLPRPSSTWASSATSATRSSSTRWAA